MNMPLLKNKFVIGFIATFIVAPSAAIAQSWSYQFYDGDAEASVAVIDRATFAVVCGETAEAPKFFFTSLGDYREPILYDEFRQAGVSIIVDGRTVETIDVEVSENPETYVFSFSGDSRATNPTAHAIIDAIRSGDHLTVAIQSIGFRESFSLSGSSAAIDRVLTHCGEW
jgi:hypothetical protein